MTTATTPTAATSSWLDRTGPAAFVLLSAYAVVRACWQVLGFPGDMAPGDIKSDLVGFTGWAGVALPLSGAVVAAGHIRRPSGVGARRALLIAGPVVGLALVAAGALFLLDLMAMMFPGIGLEFLPAGMLSRLVCVGSGTLLLLSSLAFVNDVRRACRRCGRTEKSVGRLDTTPRWAYIAAYVAVGGCVVRIIAQAAVGFGENPLSSGVAAMAFEGGFLLAGSLLPLALVHGWGRRWPRWVPFLASRRIPRWLVLGPGTGVSAGIVVYFGIMLVVMVGERLQGRNPFPPTGGLDLPETFFWFAVPAYFIWGCGMAVAAAAYFLRTRPVCRRCGR
ncbi:hypothetical protein MU582_07065 [Nocardioidaceae bacterium SCSIO 66511]|nr:hypothetical protein MU582_07065 [Nocardioidaceae bacterium SCSIO 66511]